MLDKVVDIFAEHVNQLVLPSPLMDRVVGAIGKMIILRKVVDACGSVYCGVYCLADTGCTIHANNTRPYRENAAYAATYDDCIQTCGL